MGWIHQSISMDKNLLDPWHSCLVSFLLQPELSTLKCCSLGSSVPQENISGGIWTPAGREAKNLCSVGGYLSVLHVCVCVYKLCAYINLFHNSLPFKKQEAYAAVCAVNTSKVFLYRKMAEIITAMRKPGYLKRGNRTVLTIFFTQPLHILLITSIIKTRCLFNEIILGPHKGIFQSANTCIRHRKTVSH